MLATLNLQLSPVELLDDTLSGSAVRLPDTGGEAKSGFAHLLRLRVDAALPPDLEGGEISLPEGESLPPGGNGLPPASPLLPATVSLTETGSDGLAWDASEQPVRVPQDVSQLSTERLPTPKLSPAAIPEGDIEIPLHLASEDITGEPIASTGLAGEPADILFESTVFYPPPTDALAEPPDSAPVPLALPVSNPVPLEQRVREARADAVESNARPMTRATPATVAQVTHPELAARSQESLTAAGGRIELPPGSVGLRDRGQHSMPEVRPSPVQSALQQLEVTEKLPPTDLPKRPDFLALQAGDAARDAVAETIRPRATAAQTPQAQLAAQPSQAALTPTPVTTSASDLGYSAIARPTTEVIGTPVRDAAWGEQISERVAIMAGNNLKSAEIRLTPAELGPLRVHVSVDDGAAHVTFHAQHAVTREAIEQALPRLREMLAENGLSLGQAEVGEQGVAQRDDDGQGHGPLSNRAGDESFDPENDDMTRTTSTINVRNGLVDTFA